MCACAIHLRFLVFFSYFPFLKKKSLNHWQLMFDWQCIQFPSFSNKIPFHLYFCLEFRDKHNKKINQKKNTPEQKLGGIKKTLITTKNKRTNNKKSFLNEIVRKCHLSSREFGWFYSCIQKKKPMENLIVECNNYVFFL